MTSDAQDSDQTEETKKSRPTTSDLEIDYDRSRLRGPLPTSGRKTCLRYGSMDIPDYIKARLEATRELPGPPSKLKSRLNNAIKDQMFESEARVNPINLP